MTRRRLLESGLLCLGGFAFGGCEEGAGPASPDARARRSIVDRLSSLPSARTVGQAYLALRPNEADARLLTDLLSLERGWTRVEEEIRGDYREGRVVRISGWPISLTEARVYALASLRGEG